MHVKPIRKMNNGDLKYNKKFFTEMYVEHYAPLVSYLYQFTNNISEAENIAQNCFTKIWQKRKSLTIKGSFKSYLFSVAYHTFIDSTRVNNKENLLIQELKKDAINEIYIESDTDLEEKISIIQYAIDQLPEKCKEIFLLSKIEGLPYKKIAEKLNLSLKTVESQMRIAFIKIREKLNIPINNNNNTE